jgi:serine/threonine-protein kinase
VTDARSACNRSIALSEQLSEGHFCLGRVYTLTGEHDKAAEQFELAVVLDSNSDDAYRGLAEAYTDLGKPQNAEATYRRAINLRPQYWAGYSWLGQFYFRQARYDEAADMFHKVLQYSPDNFRAYSNLAAIHTQQGRYTEAINELKKSIAIRPTSTAYSNLGTAQFGLRQFTAAASTYEAALKLDDKNFTLWGNLGDARYWAPGLRSQSGAAYAKAIELANEKLQVNPRDDSALALLAGYYAMTDRKKQALATLDRALAIAPQNLDLLLRAAIVHNHFNETDQTLAWLKKAVQAGYPIKSIQDAPDFDTLRSNHEFQALISGAK